MKFIITKTAVFEVEADSLEVAEELAQTLDVSQDMLETDIEEVA